MWSVASVTFAKGGDNVGVYVPVFAVAGAAGMVTYAVAVLLLVALWCAAGWFFASRPLVAKALSRWGHLILPEVLIAIGGKSVGSRAAPAARCGNRFVWYGAGGSATGST